MSGLCYLLCLLNSGGYDSSPDVGSFMRALGWRSFKSDGMAEPAVLFDTALRITHPSRGKGGSAKDKVSSAAYLLS